MKIGSIVSLAIFIITAILCLVQLWWSPFDSEVFIKILISAGILLLVVLGITLVKKEYLEEKEMKKDGYID